MSIKVTNFKWEKGKNDLEYIALLEKNLDAMAYKFRECAKIAKEQYNKGRKSAFEEIAYSDVIKESEYEKRIRADERAKVIDELIKTLAKSEDTMLSDKQYYTLMELKEQK